jgi:Tfp pilus assembly protein PilV
MRHSSVLSGQSRKRTASGTTLVEILVSFAISSLAISGLVSAYILSAKSSEHSSLSLSANAKALERIEETRGAEWNTSTDPPVDQLVASNFTNEIVILDLSVRSAGKVYGTNYTQISQISSNPPLRGIRVDCVWTFRNRRQTNTVETCRAPDQ